jgi:hypothetical protein
MEVADQPLGSLLNVHVDEFESGAGGSQYQYTLNGFV